MLTAKYRLRIFTGRNEVLAKVIFSQACVILSTGGGGMWVWSRRGGRCSSKFSGGCSSKFPGGGGSGPGGFSKFSGGGSPPEYGQRSAGTHPTGMHSC